jgi:ParB family transcriptional regulator, chromosome partitioning protein
VTEAPKKKGPRRPSRGNNDFYSLPHTGVTVAETIAAASAGGTTIAAPATEQAPIHGREPAPVPATPPAAGPPTSAPLAELVGNPRNPRAQIRDIHKLESIADTQYQPCLVVSRGAYLRLRPDDAPEVGDAQWVVINGNRRLAAAHEYGREALDIVVKDEVAATEQTILAASILENVDREGFDIIDEAYAVRAMIEACGGRQDLAAEKLRKKKTWVSYHQRLPDLLPELQDALREKRMTQEIARQVAAVPQERQVAVWEQLEEEAEEKRDAALRAKRAQRAAEKAQFTAVNQQGPEAGTDDGGVASAKAPRVVNRAAVEKALKRLQPEPAMLADAIYDYLGPDGVKALVAAWESKEAEPNSRP